MENRQLIGKLTLQENVSPLERNKIPNTFVVNIPNPLASYYGRFTSIEKPHSILFITKDPVSFEKILRATKKINEENDLNIRAAKCELTIGKKKYSGILLKNIQRYSHIENIQRIFQNEGFEYSKNVKLKENTNAMIRVNKFFNLIKIEDGIYQSAYNPNRYYMIIPRDLSWEEFRNVTFDIKNNVYVTSYDVAKGIFYDNNGIIEMVRIVKPDINIDMVKTVREKYLERLGQ